MRKKSHKGQPLSYLGNQNTSFSTLLDVIDPEREAQREEYLKRKKENLPLPYPKQPKKARKPAFKSTSKPKGGSKPKPSIFPILYMISLNMDYL
jgi:hypothetical protein